MSFLKRLIAYLPMVLALVPFAVFAQGGLPKQIVPCDGVAVGGGVECKCEHLVTLAQNIINGGIFMAIFLSAVLFAYAGWLYLSNEAIGQQQKAKKMFTNVAIGLVIILVAWLVVDTLMGSLLKENMSWNNLCTTLGL